MKTPLAKPAWEVRSYRGRVKVKPLSAEEAMIEYAIHFGLTGEEFRREIEGGVVILTELPNGKRYSGGGLVGLLESSDGPDDQPEAGEADQQLADASVGGVGERVSLQQVAERGDVEAAEAEATEGPQSGLSTAD